LGFCWEGFLEEEVMDNKLRKMRLVSATAILVLAMMIGGPASAVVVVGGDNGWEVSFDGNVHGFFINSDIDELPSQQSGGTLGGVALNATAPGQDVSRVRSGLLPAFFSFNVKSPTVNGLTGSARISFAPQINNANTKNAFGSQIDMREVFFNVDGSFGTISVGRTLSLFQRKNILTDMTLFGVGVHGLQKGGGTTLGRIGWGYVYPQFNSRIAYKTPAINGFQLEVGLFDPSAINGSGFSAVETDTPRFEAEASYAHSFDGGSVNFWLGGMWQEAEFVGGTLDGTDVTSQGVSYGGQLSFGGFQFTGSGYTGEALGMTLMLDLDSLDPTGQERDNDGFIVQGTYTFAGKTKIGLSYGESTADETSAERLARTAVEVDPTGGCSAAAFTCVSQLESQSAWTVGVYHDVTSWLKLVAEYTNSETEWHGGEDHEVDTFAVGGFFFW